MKSRFAVRAIVWQNEHWNDALSLEKDVSVCVDYEGFLKTFSQEME
jgi:hypothetical protein